MKRFHVTYFYSAQGMEGRADVEDFGLVNAETPEDAKLQVALAKYPVDEMYGPNNAWSSRQFFIGCLVAKLQQ